MKKILIGFMLLGFNSFADSKIATYKKYVKNECHKTKISNLLIKKSLIELVKGFECKGMFTNLIIKKCRQIDCRKLTEIYRQVQQVRAGSVVGDD